MMGGRHGGQEMGHGMSKGGMMMRGQKMCNMMMDNMGHMSETMKKMSGMMPDMGPEHMKQMGKMMQQMSGIS